MQDRKSVTFVKGQFRRAYSTPGGALVLLRVSDIAVPALGAAMAAFDAAADAADAAMADRDDDRQIVRTSDVVPMTDGPALRVLECETWTALEAWLAAAANHLTDVGITGKLTPASPVVHEKFDNSVFAVPGLMCLLETVDLPAPVDPTALMQGRNFWWAVEPKTTRTVVGPIIEWVRDGGTSVTIAIGAVQFAIDASGVTDFVTSTLSPTFNQIMAVRCFDGDQRMRQVTVSAGGALLVIEYDEAGSRRSTLGELIDLATRVAPGVKTAWAKGVKTLDIDRRSILAHAMPTAPYFVPSSAARWTHLVNREDTSVYDAFVAQILGPGHMEQLRLPETRWNRTALPHDRHLIVHTQPDLWLDTGPTTALNSATRHLHTTVSPQVLAQARADFAPIIFK